MDTRYEDTARKAVSQARYRLRSAKYHSTLPALRPGPRDRRTGSWRSAGLKPHLWRTFKVSTDPRFEEKLQDVVALYLNPPDNAVVFSFDEKSSVQALDRTQPGLPLKPGRCGTMTGGGRGRVGPGVPVPQPALASPGSGLCG